MRQPGPRETEQVAARGAGHGDPQVAWGSQVEVQGGHNEKRGVTQAPVEQLGVPSFATGLLQNRPCARCPFTEGVNVLYATISFQSRLKST